MERVSAAVLIDEAHQEFGKLDCAQFPADERFDPSLVHRSKINLDEMIGFFPRLRTCRNRNTRAAACDQQQLGQLASDGGQKAKRRAVKPVQVFKDQRAWALFAIGKQCNDQRFNAGGPGRSCYLPRQLGFGEVYVDDLA